MAELLKDLPVGSLLRVYDKWEWDSDFREYPVKLVQHWTEKVPFEILSGTDAPIRYDLNPEDTVINGLVQLYP